MAIPTPIVDQPQVACDLDPQQENLVQLVRAKAQDFLETGQANDLEARIIWRELEESVQNVFLDCPRQAVAEVGIAALLVPTARGLGSHVRHPDNYIRFLSVKADTWYIGVYQLAEAGGLAEQFQVIPFTNATPYRPLAVDVPDPDGIVCYPDARSYVTLYYVPRLTPTEVPELLLESLQWLALSKTLQYDEPTFAGLAEQRYQKALSQLSNRDNALPPTESE
jgi:hypothetical protein